MFSTFKILVIYLIIPSRCTYIPTPNDETTLSFREKVKEEMNDFNEILNKIQEAPIRYKLEGKLEEIVKRAVKADVLLENQGGLKMQKNDADKYRLLLGLTYRIDCLESTLAPGLDFKGKQRRVRWSTIFSLETPAVKKFKKKVEDAGMTEVAFAECIERLCNERNNRAGHAKISLPKIVNEKTIEGALAIMEITDDKPVVETVKIIVAPVEDLDATKNP